MDAASGSPSATLATMVISTILGYGPRILTQADNDKQGSMTLIADNDSLTR